MLMMCVGIGAWADTTGTITFGTNDVKINAASVEGDDDLGNSWTITTVGTTSFTTNAAYYQVGSSNKPATSITFTTTLPESSTIKSMSAKFGGFTGTAGTVTLKVGSTSVGSGSLNAANDVTVNSTSSATGTVLTVTLTGIAKGVKVYNISYTIGEESSEPVDASWTIDSNVSVKEGGTKRLTLTTNYDGELIAASENDNIATASYDEETKILSITGLNAGSTRIGFLGDETSSYNAIERYVDVTVRAPGVISVGTVTVALNNELFGTSYTTSNTSCSKKELDLVGQDYGIDVEVKNGESTAMYVTDDQVRIYNGYTMEVSVPTGYVITTIAFNEPTSNKKWDANPTPSAGEFTTDTKIWTGSANDVTFTFTAQCRMVSMDVTIAAAPTATITLNDACHDKEGVVYGTYSNSSAWVVPAGLTVSEVGIDGEGKLVVASYNEGNVVPANTGVMVSALEGGDYTITLSDEAGDHPAGVTNALHPSSEAMTGNNLFYRLTMHNGTQIGFAWGAEDGAAFSLAANKAYLTVSKSAGVKSLMWFGDTETAIQSVEAENNSKVIYDLQGRRVNKAQKGLYIVNGKKVLF